MIPCDVEDPLGYRGIHFTFGLEIYAAQTATEQFVSKSCEGFLVGADETEGWFFQQPIYTEAKSEWIFMRLVEGSALTAVLTDLQTSYWV